MTTQSHAHPSTHRLHCAIAVVLTLAVTTLSFVVRHQMHGAASAVVFPLATVAAAASFFVGIEALRDDAPVAGGVAIVITAIAFLGATLLGADAIGFPVPWPGAVPY